MPLNATVKSTVITKLEEYEGRYNHLYLDTKGKVTVGVGHLLANKTAIHSVTMYKIVNNLPSIAATIPEKDTEYNNIAKQKKNYKASWYKQHTTLVMKDTDINAQRDKHIDSFYKELTGIYKKSNGYADDFDNFPEKVQIALFDMIFNLGAGKLRNTFPSFNTAIKSNDWAKAGSESNRPDVNASRNQFVSDLFNAAAAAAVAATAKQSQTPKANP